MECREMKDYLERYWDGELDEEDRTRVEAHLAECEGCRASLAEFRAVDEAGRSFAVEDPGRKYWRGMTREVHARVRDIGRTTAGASAFFGERKRVLRPERIGYRLAGLTAAAVFVLLLARLTFFEGGFFPFRPNAPKQEEREGSSARPGEEALEEEHRKRSAVPGEQGTSATEEPLADVAEAPRQREPARVPSPESRQSGSPPAAASRDIPYTEASEPRIRTMEEVRSSAGVEDATLPRAYDEKEMSSDRIEQAGGSGSASIGKRAVEELERDIARTEELFVAREDRETDKALVEELSGLYFERATVTGDPVHIRLALRFYREHDDAFRGKDSAVARIDSLRKLLEEIEKR